jgi:bifunctional non-homologous end joining protein LigD
MPERLPRFLDPMLSRPAPAEAVARHADWIAEVKWDGMRAQLRLDGHGALTVRSRHRTVFTDRFPELVPLAVLRLGALVADAELVCLDPADGPDFFALRTRLTASPRRRHQPGRTAPRHPDDLRRPASRRRAGARTPLP